jgi:hypothetical protein
MSRVESFSHSFTTILIIFICIICSLKYGEGVWKGYEQYPELVLPSGQKLILDILANITIELHPFCAYALFPALL